MTTLQSGSDPTASSASCRSAVSSNVSALRRSGRFSVMTLMCDSTGSTRTFGAAPGAAFPVKRASPLGSRRAPHQRHVRVLRELFERLRDLGDGRAVLLG